LLAPLYVGLLLSLVPLIYRFFIEFLHLMEGIATLKMQEITLKILELLDVVLLGNLIIIVIKDQRSNRFDRSTSLDGSRGLQRT
jgi:uncharacterized protein (TIGR00645 family)